MTKPRQARPRPAPLTPKEKAELDLAYREIREGLDAYAARRGLPARI